MCGFECGDDPLRARKKFRGIKRRLIGGKTHGQRFIVLLAFRHQFRQARRLEQAGGDERFDKVVVVTAPDEVRRTRSDVATADREQRLIPDDEKAARADYVFANNGSLEELDDFVRSVMDDLTR